MKNWRQIPKTIILLLFFASISTISFAAGPFQIPVDPHRRSTELVPELSIDRVIDTGFMAAIKNYFNFFVAKMNKSYNNSNFHPILKAILAFGSLVLFLLLTSALIILMISLTFLAILNPEIAFSLIVLIFLLTKDNSPSNVRRTKAPDKIVNSNHYKEFTAQTSATSASDLKYAIEPEQIEKELLNFVNTTSKNTDVKTADVPQIEAATITQEAQGLVSQLIEKNLETEALINLVEKSPRLEQLIDLKEESVLESDLKELLSTINSLENENAITNDQEKIKEETTVVDQANRVQRSLIKDKTIPMNPILVKVYPNPTEGQVTVKINGIETLSQIDVYSSVGQKIFSETTNEKQTNLNLKAYDAGIYFFRISNGQSSITESVIKK
jgi:hypothetical protein